MVRERREGGGGGHIRPGEGWEGDLTDGYSGGAGGGRTGIFRKRRIKNHLQLQLGFTCIILYPQFQLIQFCQASIKRMTNFNNSPEAFVAQLLEISILA
jgi:hypothetical protein